MDTCDFVTDDLVRLALRNDRGKDASLLSYEFKPLINKGDHHIGYITTVMVRYVKEGFEYEESYVVKLNPERPYDDLFTEMVEKCFIRESDFLSTIIDGMNEQLEHINLPPLKAPKLYATSLEKGKEVFIAENLKIQGFRNVTLIEGLDKNHSKLVLKELGRLHASSFLYEESLYPKSIKDLFKFFEEPKFDNSQKYYKILEDSMMISKAEGICSFMKKADSKYEKAVKWMDKNIHRMMEYFNDNCYRENSFYILAHGDFHVNNMLFKYDEDNIPVDVRLLDFQFTRKASPASDLNYFFYVNLEGDFRKREMDRMILTYYESFREVFERAGRDSPLSYKDLVNELEKHKFYGLSCAVLTLPVYMAKSIDAESDSEKDREDDLDEKECEKVEALMERGGPLQDRLMSVFEEMIDDRLFD